MINNIHGSGDGGGGSGTNPAPVIQPDSLQSDSTARIIDLICEGEIQGLANGSSSIYINGTPLIDQATGQSPFNTQYGIGASFLNGTADQLPILGFGEVDDEITVGLQVFQETPLVFTVDDPDLDAFRVTIQIPALYYAESNGNINDTTVSFTISLQSNGASTYSIVNFPGLNSNPISISGKASSTFEQAYTVNLPVGGAPWNIMVTRVSGDSGEIGYANAEYIGATYVSRVTQIIYTKMNYMNSAICGIYLNAQYFNLGIPSRSYDIEGLIIQVPSNYNPTTRAYTGIWDGTFQMAYSNNPAWVLYDLLTSTRYGLGQWIDAAQIDKYTLYTIGQFCDVSVPDGQGGMEPRYTFNGILNNLNDAYSTIQAITAVFNTMCYWGSGMVTFSQDIDADAVKLVTPANVQNGTFNYSGTAIKSRHTAVIVTWNDPELLYNATATLVEDTEMIQQFGYRETRIVALGCTSHGQAVRTGKWLLFTERYQTQTVTYTCSFDQADLRPGDIISIADPYYAGVRMGGRITSVTAGNEVTIDSPIEFLSDETYSFSCVYPDGTISSSFAITNSGSTTTMLNLAGVLTQTPINGAMFVVTASNVAPVPYRVISVRETAKNLFEVTALLHYVGKYEEIEQNITVAQPTYSILPTGALLPPAGVTFMEYLYQAGVNIQSALQISWSASTDLRVSYYNVYVQSPSATGYALAGTTPTTSFTLDNTFPGLYLVQIIAVSATLNLNSPTVSASYEAVGLYETPPDVTAFGVQVLNRNAYLQWSTVASLNLDHYEIRYTPQVGAGITWGGSQVLYGNVSPSLNSIPIQSMIGTYSIKAITSQGVYSANADFAETNIGNVLGMQVLHTVEEDPAYGGTFSSCAVLGGSLQLTGADTVDSWPNIDNVLNWDIGNDGITGSGTYTFTGCGSTLGASFDAEGVFTMNVVSNIIAFGSDLYSNVDLWTNTDLVADWDGGDPSEWGIQLQVRTTPDNPNSGIPTWSGWMNFYNGDYTCRAFQFRLALTSAQVGISPIVSQCQIIINLPNKFDGAANLTSSAGGSVVDFTQIYYNTPSVGITGNNLEQGDYWTITSLSSTGFTIQFFNSSNTGVARNYSWTSNGF
jgi:predicted phage tail protein